MTTPRPNPPASVHGHNGGHGRHGLMMLACCVPMLIVAVALVATGVVGVGFLVFAVGCTLMMAMMMRGMSSAGKTEMHTSGDNQGAPDVEPKRSAGTAGH